MVPTPTWTSASSPWFPGQYFRRVRPFWCCHWEPQFLQPAHDAAGRATPAASSGFESALRQPGSQTASSSLPILAQAGLLQPGDSPLHQEALKSYDAAVLQIQATLSTKSGGLGRASQCPSPPFAIVNELLLAADHVPLPPPLSLRQQDLSRAVDRNTAAQLLPVMSGPGHETRP